MESTLDGLCWRHILYTQSYANAHLDVLAHQLAGIIISNYMYMYICVIAVLPVYARTPDSIGELEHKRANASARLFDALDLEQWANKSCYYSKYGHQSYAVFKHAISSDTHAGPLHVLGGHERDVRRFYT